MKRALPEKSEQIPSKWKNVTLPDPSATPSSNQVILAIGDTDHSPKSPSFVQVTDEIYFMAFNILSAKALQGIGPRTVLAPLISQTFDAVELGCFLKKSRFQGILQIMMPEMPNSKIVERELKAAIPDLALAFTFPEEQSGSAIIAGNLL